MRIGLRGRWSILGRAAQCDFSNHGGDSLLKLVIVKITYPICLIKLIFD